MNQLRGAGPQAVHGEQPPILAMKEHLEEAAPVAEDLAAGDLAIPRDAGLVRYARGGQLVLRRTHHRNLGDRVDADGKVAGHRSRFDSEGLARGQPALLRGRGRETRISDDVAGREDVRHRRPEGVVDLEPTAVVRRQARRREIEALGRRQPTGREEDGIGHQSLAGLEVEDRAQGRALGHGERLHAFTEPEGDVALAELVHQLVDDLAIEELERPLAALDQGHLHADRGEHRRVLDADHTGAHHRQRSRQLLEGHELIRVQHDLAVRLDTRRRRRSRTDRDDHVPRRDPAHAAVAADRQSVRIDK